MTDYKLEKKVALGVAWKFAERILAQLVSFVVSVVLARVLLPDDYGIIAMVMVFINIANVFVVGGLNAALIQKKESDDLDFSTVFYITLCVSLIMYVVLFFTSPLIAKFYKNNLLVWVLRVFGLKLIITSYNSIQHAYVSKHMLFRKFFWSTLAGTIISGIVGVIMALKGFGVWALVSQYLINSLMDTIVLNFTIPWRPKLIFSKERAKPLVKFGWKAMMASLFGTLYNNLRALIIGRVYTSEDLAYYNRGKNIPDLIVNNVVTSISSVLFPAMSSEGDDVERVKTITRKSIRMVTYIVFPMLAGMALIAKPLILILYTEKWIESIKYVPLVCLSFAFHTISETNLQAINALGRSDIILKLEFIKKPIGIFLVILAIPHGVYAVIVTMPIQSFIAMLCNMFPNKKLLNYSIREQINDLKNNIAVTLFMAIAVFSVGHFINNLWLLIISQLIIGGAIYILGSIILKNKEFDYLLSLLRAKKRK